MEYFNVRVVLHDGAPADYDKLSQPMGTYGMTDVVTADGGRRYRLPPGEYCISVDSTKETVRQAAEKAAAATGKLYAVRVTQGPSSWIGLDEV